MPIRSVGWWVPAGVLVVLAVGGFVVGLWALLDLGSIGRDTTSPFAPLDDNGAYYTSSADGDQVSILRHRIDGAGAFGDPTQVYQGPGEGRTGPGVVDGRSPWVLLGWYQDGVSERLQVHAADTGELLGAVAAGQWCGGEGPDGFACTLLDDRRLARTTVLAPGSYQPVSIIVSSLESGSTLAEHGPFPGLQAVLGTESPDHLVLQVADPPAGSASADPAAGLPTGEMVDLDLTTGRTTRIGRYPAGWSPLCVHTVQWQADGSPERMSVVGIQRAGQGPDQQVSLSGLGPADIARVTWSPGEGYQPSGCSADGRFVYLTFLESDSESVTRVVVDRINVQDGRRATVLDTPPPIPGPWTR